MEEQDPQLIEKSFENIEDSKCGGFDVDLLDAVLQNTEKLSTEQLPHFDYNNENETTVVSFQRPVPPTPPLEEDFKPINEEICTAPRAEKTKKSKKQKIKENKSLVHQLGMEDCIVPCLLSVKELRERFQKRYKLNLDLIPLKNSNRRNHLTAYKRKWDLLLKLEKWEKTLNECSLNEPYISVENKVDNAGPPEGFVYIAENKMPSDLDYLFDKDYLVGCNCERCTPLTCDCPKNSGGSFAYDRFGKVLFEPGKPIYECNSSCSCSISCRNRVVQRGRTARMTIFRTANGRGWGVKTMDPIFKNQFVTEYVGEVLTNEEAEERGKIYDHIGQTYLFDLDYNEGECAFTIDAKKYGNISHFINHSCDPNLNVYGIWVETLDPRMPKIAFFASRDIKPGEELTFDYLMTAGDSPSPVRSSAKKTKRIPCQCGAKNCRSYLF